MKKCTHCKLEKNEIEFGKTKTIKSGFNSWCKQCVIENGKKYRTTRKNCVGCGSEFFCEKNRENTARFCSKPCYFKNLKGRFVGEKHWQFKGGYELKLWHNRNRADRMKKVPGSHTYEELCALLENSQYMCACCKRQEPEIKLTVDHIIPISKGGTNDIENIQPLCRSCNSRKYNHLISIIELSEKIRITENVL